jgi:hypothetical protein
LHSTGHTRTKPKPKEKKAFLNLSVYIVAYLLKARTMEPEEEPLLVYDSETIFVSR